MQKEIYNLSQWHWAADRVHEGYGTGEVAAFLGVTINGLRHAMRDIGRWVEKGDRIPLSERKHEFNALQDDGSPVRTHNVTVIGVYKDGTQRRWTTMAAAARELGVHTSSVQFAVENCGTCKGWRFRRDGERAKEREESP